MKLFTLLLFVFFSQSFSFAVAEEASCRAVDISDRAYLPHTLERIQSATQSIDVSMYSVAIGTASDDPAWQIIGALKNAARNGKRVRIWLNSRQASIGSTRTFLRDDIQEGLQKDGIQVLYVDSKRRLHDKLIVIDGRIVIDGSMNWTREALVKNFESASVMDCPELAAAKIKRLESFPLLKDQPAQKQRESEESFSFSVSLLKDHSKFPSAMEEKEARTLAFYLMLLEEASRTGQKTLTLSVDDWSKELRFKNRLIGWKLQNDMERHLDFLKKRYGLIEWEKVEKGSVRLTLLSSPGDDKIRIPSGFVRYGYLKRFPPKTLFVYLIVLHKAQLEGNVPFWMGNLDDVAKEFHTNRVTMIQGLTDLKRMNLIEIFPSEKKKIDGRWQREFTNRYLLNPVLSETERQKPYGELSGKYGQDRIGEAVKLADSIDEPEDPEVAAQFANFLSHYSEEEVQKATAIVSGFSRNNPLRTPGYVRGILEGEHH